MNHDPVMKKDIEKVVEGDTGRRLVVGVAECFGDDFWCVCVCVCVCVCGVCVCVLE